MLTGHLLAYPMLGGNLQYAIPIYSTKGTFVENTKPATTARPRKIVITVNYHYNGPGRRVNLRSDIAKSVQSSVVRRLQKHGALVVDSVNIKDM